MLRCLYCVAYRSFFRLPRLRNDRSGSLHHPEKNMGLPSSAYKKPIRASEASKILHARLFSDCTKPNCKRIKNHLVDEREIARWLAARVHPELLENTPSTGRRGRPAHERLQRIDATLLRRFPKMTATPFILMEGLFRLCGDDVWPLPDGSNSEWTREAAEDRARKHLAKVRKVIDRPLSLEAHFEVRGGRLTLIVPAIEDGEWVLKNRGQTPKTAAVRFEIAEGLPSASST